MKEILKESPLDVVYESLMECGLSELEVSVIISKIIEKNERKNAEQSKTIDKSDK
ncbi:MAG: hypothetical protein WBO70_00355 [Erysipelotrichaceae bacterium]